MRRYRAAAAPVVASWRPSVEGMTLDPALLQLLLLLLLLLLLHRHRRHHRRRCRLQLCPHPACDGTSVVTP